MTLQRAILAFVSLLLATAAASAAEMRPLHERAAATHTVFTPDLPGYGLSDRSDRAYSPRLYTDALHQVMQAVHARCGDAPVPAVGLSLGCEFLARAEAGEIAAIASIGTAGILNRCQRLIMVDENNAPCGELRAQTEHPIYYALGRAKRIYWDIYQDKAPVPAGLTLFNYPI